MAGQGKGTSVTMIEAVKIPEGTRGDWSVRRFEITKKDAEFGAIRAIVSGRGGVTAGVYTQLHHARRGIIMSDTPDERRDHYEAVCRSCGHVLINGLGIGMVLAAILKKPDVTKITVVEIAADVIALVAPHYADKRVSVVNASAYDYQPPKGERYGAVWHDIWDTLCGDNLPEMTRLKRKYGRRCDWQGCWGERFIRRRTGR